MSPIPVYQVQGLNYLSHPHHRNQNPNKSQWTIDEPDERLVFEHCILNNCIINDNGWGLHLVNAVPAYLGVLAGNNGNAFIAKFVNDPNANQWHGYPADHAKNQDRPPGQVIMGWMNLNLLPKSKIRKIMKGQPCKL